MASALTDNGFRCSDVLVPVADADDALPTERLIATLSACADVLSDHGCRLAIELAAAVGWERAGMVIGSLHFIRNGAQCETLATLGAEQIAALQWSDAPAPMPGDGGLDLSTMASAVRSTGWHGVVSAEVLSDRLRARPKIE